MKKYFILLPVIFFALAVRGQNGFGFDIGIGTSKAPMIAAKYYFDKNAASIGATYQIFNDAIGKKTDGMIPGTTGIGEGDYFYSIDIGYTRVLSEDFSVSADLSIGKREYYYNFMDNTAAEGAYHFIHKTKSQVGGGGYVHYNFNQIWGIYAGYNSLRKATFGLEFRFLKEKQY